MIETFGSGLLSWIMLLHRASGSCCTVPDAEHPHVIQSTQLFSDFRSSCTLFGSRIRAIHFCTSDFCLLTSDSRLSVLAPGSISRSQRPTPSAIVERLWPVNGWLVQRFRSDKRIKTSFVRAFSLGPAAITVGWARGRSRAGGGGDRVSRMAHIASGPTRLPPFGGFLWDSIHCRPLLWAVVRERLEASASGRAHRHPTTTPTHDPNGINEPIQAGTQTTRSDDIFSFSATHVANAATQKQKKKDPSANDIQLACPGEPRKASAHSVFSFRRPTLCWKKAVLTLSCEIPARE